MRLIRSAVITRGIPPQLFWKVLDSEQNNKFTDHYVEIPIDLSEVLFIATANDVQTIPRRCWTAWS